MMNINDEGDHKFNTRRNSERWLLIILLIYKGIIFRRMKKDEREAGVSAEAQLTCASHHGRQISKKKMSRGRRPPLLF